MPFDMNAAFDLAAQGKLDPKTFGQAPPAATPAPAANDDGLSGSMYADAPTQTIKIDRPKAAAAPEAAAPSPPPPPADVPKPKFDMDAAFNLAAQGKLDPKAFTASQAPPPDQMQPLPPAKTPEAPQQSQQSVTQPNKGAPPQPDTDRPMEWSDVPSTFAGSTVATLDGIQRGLLGDKVTSGINAAVQTPFRMLSGWQGPVSAFNEGYDADQQRHQAQQNRYPIADVGGQVGGAVAGGMAAAPALGWNAATGALPKIGAALSYGARNAAFGGGMAAASGNDPTTGALIGGAIPAAHVLGKGVVSALGGGAGAIADRIGPVIGGESGKAASIGRKLNQELPAGAGAIKSSPVGPYTLAQATGDPRIAAMQEVAKPYNPSSMLGMEGRQKTSIQQQIGKIGAASSTPESSAATVDTLKAARDAAEEHNTALWNKPEVAQTMIPKDQVRAMVRQVIADLPHGLQLGVTGALKKAVKHFNSMPDQVSIGDLNSVRTAIRLASKPSEKNPWAAAVGARLQEAVTDGMDQTLMNTPGLPPGAQQAWHEAREFTRQLRTGPLSHSQIEPMLKSDQPEAAGARAFRFSAGQGDGAAALAGVADFIKQVPKGAQLSADVIQATRNQIASAAQEAANVGNGTLQKFLQKNAHWLKSSGVLDQHQIDAVTQLQDYVDALQKPGDLLKGVGAATYDRTAMSKNFITHIMSPVMRLGLTLGLTHTHGVPGVIVGNGIDHVVGAVEGSLKSMTTAAIADSEVAKDYMMKASKGNLAMMKPASRDLYLKSQSAINNVLAQEAAPSASPPALQMSH